MRVPPIHDRDTCNLSEKTKGFVLGALQNTTTNDQASVTAAWPELAPGIAPDLRRRIDPSLGRTEYGPILVETGVRSPGRMSLVRLQHL